MQLTIVTDDGIEYGVDEEEIEENPYLKGMVSILQRYLDQLPEVEEDDV